MFTIVSVYIFVDSKKNGSILYALPSDPWSLRFILEQIGSLFFNL